MPFRPVTIAKLLLDYEFAAVEDVATRHNNVTVAERV